CCAPDRTLVIPCLLFLNGRRPPLSPLFPYTTLFRSSSRVTNRARKCSRLNGPGHTHPGEAEDAPLVRVAALHLVDHLAVGPTGADRKSTRLNSSHVEISYAVFCLKKKQQSHARSPRA